MRETCAARYFRAEVSVTPDQALALRVFAGNVVFHTVMQPKSLETQAHPCSLAKAIRPGIAACAKEWEIEEDTFDYPKILDNPTVKQGKFLCNRFLL